MGFLSKFEGKVEDTFEGAADKMFDSPISPVQIAKKAEKKMKREKMVGAGKEFAPTLYTILVNPDDDRRLFGYYPTLAGETETYLSAKAREHGLTMDGQPLVRFKADADLKSGKFQVIAEPVAASIVARLRDEEMRRYGILRNPVGPGGRGAANRAGYNQAGYGNAGAYPQASPQNNLVPINSQAAARRQNPAFGNGAVPGANVMPGANAMRGANVMPRANAGAYAGAGVAAAAGVAAGAAAGAFAGQQLAAGGVDPRMTAAAQGAATGARFVDEATGAVYALRPGRMTIGRESKNDICVRDINASRMHAELVMEPSGAWRVTDLDSMNGTFLNDQLIDSEILQDGDCLTIGLTNIIFEQD